jgi:hypothetical protein
MALAWLPFVHASSWRERPGEWPCRSTWSSRSDQIPGSEKIEYDSFEIEIKTDNSFTHIFSMILEPISLFVIMHEAQPKVSSSFG